MVFLPQPVWNNTEIIIFCQISALWNVFDLNWSVFTPWLKFFMGQKVSYYIQITHCSFNTVVLVWFLWTLYMIFADMSIKIWKFAIFRHFFTLPPDLANFLILLNLKICEKLFFLCTDFYTKRKTNGLRVNLRLG